MRRNSIFASLLCLCSIAIAASSEGVDFDKGRLTVSISQEPRSLNTLTAESVSYTAQLLVHLNEGLLRYDGRRRLQGGVAERWEMDEKQIRFWLRPEARWSNGEPVTANDFVFAWQQLLRPGTASPSANLASPILNASKVLAGELPVTALGVRANGDREFIVDLAHPCGWCLKLMTNSIFYPINQAFYEASGAAYGNSAASHLANGAFEIETWERGKRLTARKNPHYWRSKEVALNGITFDYIGADPKTQLNLFRSDALAAASLDRDTIPDAIKQGLRLRTDPSGHLFNIQFSHVDNMLSANQNIRRAISLVIDKDALVNRVIASPGTRVADSMFHDWLTIDDIKYTQARPPRKHRPDIAEAKRLLAIARIELKLPDRPRMTLTINDSNLYGRIAEYLQSVLDEHLNIEVAIDPQMTQMMVEKWRNGTSDMTLITWPVDVDDPMDQISFLGDPNFRKVFKGLYAGDDMTALYVNARQATGLEARIETVDQVHRFFADKVTMMPLFESYSAFVVNPGIRGFVWQPVRGYADYRYVQLVGR